MCQFVFGIFHFISRTQQTATMGVCAPNPKPSPNPAETTFSKIELDQLLVIVNQLNGVLNTIVEKLSSSEPGEPVSESSSEPNFGDILARPNAALKVKELLVQAVSTGNAKLFEQLCEQVKKFKTSGEFLSHIKLPNKQFAHIMWKSGIIQKIHHDTGNPVLGYRLKFWDYKDEDFDDIFSNVYGCVQADDLPLVRVYAPLCHSLNFCQQRKLFTMACQIGNMDLVRCVCTFVNVHSIRKCIQQFKIFCRLDYDKMVKLTQVLVNELGFLKSDFDNTIYLNLLAHKYRMKLCQDSKRKLDGYEEAARKRNSF